MKVGLITLFVLWHLFFMFMQNPVDMGLEPLGEWCEEVGCKPLYDDYIKPADLWTWWYGNFVGAEQGWVMFSPPMARSSAFPGARIEFTDGSWVELASPNEPEPTSFFRFGGWRQRKLEYHLVWADEDELLDDEELPLWETYARWCLHRWQVSHPDDQRTPQRIVLQRRRFYFPKPDEDPLVSKEPDVVVIARFGPDGKLLR